MSQRRPPQPPAATVHPTSAPPSAPSAPEPQAAKPFAETRVSLRLPAHADFVRVARLTAAGVASRMQFTYDEVEDIKLAVAEACNNAILHAELPPRSSALASPAAPAQTIEVTFATHDDRLEIWVTDGGRVQAPEHLTSRKAGAAPLPPAETAQTADVLALPESGMGLILMESLMDEVEHRAGPHTETVVRMMKRTRAETAPISPAVKAGHLRAGVTSATPRAAGKLPPLPAPGARTEASPRQDVSPV